MKLTQFWLLFLGVACVLRSEIVPIKKLLGADRIAIIEQASSCSAELISAEPDGVENESPVYKILTKRAPQPLSTEARDTLRRALLKDWDDDGSRSGCWPTPGVRYIFRHGSESVSLIVCYRCLVVLVEEKGKVVGGRSGRDIAQPLRSVAASFLTEAEMKNLP